MVTKTILRFEVPIDDKWHKKQCPNREIKSVGNRDTGTVEFWVECVSSKEFVSREFQIFGTGHPIPLDAVYVGTAPRTNLGLVWHLYEREYGSEMR